MLKAAPVKETSADVFKKSFRVKAIRSLIYEWQ